MSRYKRIETILNEVLVPKYFEIENESHRHHVPDNSETHFRLVIVSSLFESLSRIDRHRLINKLLAEELQNGLHALTLHLFTEEEWKTRKMVPASPACRDGYER